MEIKINTNNIESLSFIKCKKTDCKNNLRYKSHLGCNLKNIEIGSNGECTYYEKTKN